jgi:hypothetical protein
MEGIVHYELLERNLTVTAGRFCQELRRLEETVQQKRTGRRHGVILQDDNARPHTANMTKAAIQELDWQILPHAPLLLGPSPIALPPLPLSPTICAYLQNRLGEFPTAKPADFFKNEIGNRPNFGRQSLIIEENT